MHQTFEQAELKMAKAFKKLTRRARRMAKPETREHSGKPAKITVLPRQISDQVDLQSADSTRRFWPCPAAPNQASAQSVTFSSNEPSYASGSAGRQENVHSSIAPFPFSPPSAFTSWTPYPMSHSAYVWSPPPTTYPSLPLAFLLGATWALKAPVLYASTPQHIF